MRRWPLTARKNHKHHLSPHDGAGPDDEEGGGHAGGEDDIDCNQQSGVFFPCVCFKIIICQGEKFYSIAVSLSTNRGVVPTVSLFLNRETAMQSRKIAICETFNLVCRLLFYQREQ